MAEVTTDAVRFPVDSAVPADSTFSVDSAKDVLTEVLRQARVLSGPTAAPAKTARSRGNRLGPRPAPSCRPPSHPLPPECTSNRPPAER